MGKIRDGLIRLLGGCTRAELEMKEAEIELLTRCPNDVKRFCYECNLYLDRRKDWGEQFSRDKKKLAMKLGAALAEMGLIQFEKIMSLQPRGPVSAYKLRATISVLDQRYLAEEEAKNDG